MNMDTIIIDNYKFELELLPTQINIKLTDTQIFEMYEVTINEDDNMCVKPLKKFYSMIVNSLNKEINYNITIDNKIPEFIISYNNEIIDIQQKITLLKNESHTTRELLLINKIKDLEEQINSINHIDFGRKPYSDEIINFNLNDEVLDFRPYYISYDKYNTDEINDNMYDYISEWYYNKFKKVKKIITNDISINGIIVDFTEINKKKIITKINNSRVFKLHDCNRTLYMPSVKEYVIYLQPYNFIVHKDIDYKCCLINTILNLNLKPFPNLEKLVIINNGYTNMKVYMGPGNSILGSVNKIKIIDELKYNLFDNLVKIHKSCKKIKIVSLQKMDELILQSSINESKIFAKENNFILDLKLKNISINI